jgi:hypothetical protein
MAKRLDPEVHEKRLALYRQGMTDGQIAQECGCSYSVILGWRTRLKLPTNTKNPQTLRAAGRRPAVIDPEFDTALPVPPRGPDVGDNDAQCGDHDAAELDMPPAAPVKTYKYIDLDELEKIEPLRHGGRRAAKPVISVTSNLVRVGVAAVRLAPAEHRVPAGVGCYLSQDRKIIVVRPGDGVHRLRLINKSGALVFQSVAISGKLEGKGIKVPARYAAEWDEFHGAWVGRMA